MDVDGNDQVTRRQWLIRQAILHGASPFMAVEAVASVAIEHPEWDLEEVKTMHEWESATLP